MWNRVEIKENGKNAMRKNYGNCVLIAAILSILTTAGVSNLKGDNAETIKEMFADTSISPEFFWGAIASITLLSILSSIAVVIFLKNPLIVGAQKFFIKNVEEDDVSFKELFYVFKEGGFFRIFGTMLLRDIIVGLFSALLVIPGVIVAYSYRMVPYILADDKEIGAVAALKLSREMMKGNKWKAFILDLSFIGWYILASLTFGIVNVFYVSPYKKSTDAQLYISLRNQ